MVKALAALLTLLALLAPFASAQPLPEAQLDLVLDPAPHPPFEGEMVLATLRGRYVGNVARDELVFPPIDDFDWMQLTPPEWSQQRVGQRAVNSFALRLAFFPRRDGPRNIPPIEHALTFVDGNQRRDVTAVSPPVSIAVEPRPATGTEWWLPARGVTVRDEWAPRPDRLAPDEWTVRTVTLEVAGQPPHTLPSAPPMYAGGLFTFGEPDERTVRLTADGPVSTIIWRYRMKPQTDAPADLDEIPLSWFDTEARAGRSLLLEGRHVGFAASVLPREPGPVARWSVPAGALAGFGLGLALLAPRLGLRRGAAMGRVRRAVTAIASALRLAIAERRADGPSARAALLGLIHARGADPEGSGALAELDARLFGPPGGADPVPAGLTRRALAEGGGRRR